MKICKGCKISKELNAFSKHSQMKDGHLNFCKECKCLYSLVWYKNKYPERYQKILTRKALKEKGLKLCTNCGKTKGFIDFSKDKRASDGLTSKCIDCYIEQHKKCWSTVEGRLKRKEYSRRSNAKNPTKVKARQAVKRAVKSGRLIKEVCAYPNGKCDGEIQGHHWDYSKPLAVVWFCVKHHALANNVQKLFINQ